MGCPHDRADPLERGGAGHDALADRGVLPDERPILLAERSRLLKDGIGDGELADVVELGCESQLFQLSGFQLEPRTDGNRELDNAELMLLRARIALGERPHEHLVRLASQLVEPRLLRVEALVGKPESTARIGRLLRQDRRTERGADIEPLPLLRESGDGCVICAPTPLLSPTGARTQNSSPPSR